MKRMSAGEFSRFIDALNPSLIMYHTDMQVWAEQNPFHTECFRFSSVTVVTRPDYIMLKSDDGNIMAFGAVKNVEIDDEKNDGGIIMTINCYSDRTMTECVPYKIMAS